MDDRMIFVKGTDTVANWRAAFGYYNALQPYFFLISYLPINLKLSLPSLPVPGLDSHTAQFRFLLAYIAFLHLLVALSWAWFLERISSSHLVNFVGFLLFATSPTLVLWTPQPESRIIGLPLVLAGTLPLLRLDALLARRGMRTLIALALSGSFFGLAQALHYTSLYLIAPVSAVCWISAACKLQRWRAPRFWLHASIFGLGVAWIQLLMEWLSHKAGLPFARGPLMTLVGLRSYHASGQSLLFDLRLWAGFFESQMGLPMVLCICLGALVYRGRHRQAGLPSINTNQLVGAVFLSLAYLLLCRTKPFFRQTSIIQPFLFFLAAVGIVYIADRIRVASLLRFGVIVLLTCGVGFTQWREAQAVFVGHQGLGKALEWASAYKQERGLQTLRIAWFEDLSSLSTAEALAQANPEDWLVTYFPWQLLEGRSPSLLPAFEDVHPLFSAPTLYSTGAMRAEIQATWPDFDLTRQPELAEARVYRIGDLIQYLRPSGRIAIRSVTSDSMASPFWEPGNVFDRDAAPDGFTAWISNEAPGPHYLDIEFVRPVTLGSMRIVLPPTDRSAGRIVSAEVQDATQHRTLWRGENLDSYQVVAPSWKATALTGLRVVIKRFGRAGKAMNAARIEEITFPGFVIEPPALERVLPALRATAVTVSGSHIAVHGANQTPYVVIVVNGTPISTTFVDPTQVSGSLPAEDTGTATARIWLTDYVRTSNSLELEVPKPLRIARITADSEFGIGYTKEKVFDLGVSPDGITSWASADSPMPHYLEVDFIQATDIREVRVINRPMTRIGELTVEARKNGRWKEVWEDGGLSSEPIIEIGLRVGPIEGIRFVVGRNYIGGKPRNVADIEEIEFPGFQPLLR
jgi:hypothetical protein